MLLTCRTALAVLGVTRSQTSPFLALQVIPLDVTFTQELIKCLEQGPCAFPAASEAQLGKSSRSAE